MLRWVFRSRSRRAVPLCLLASVGLACSLYHAAPLPEPSDLERGTRWSPEELNVAVAEIHHPILESVPIDLANGLSPTEAALLAVALNPDLAALRATQGDAAAGLVAAGLLPNPSFNAAVDHPYGRGAVGQVEALALSLSIDTQQIVSHWARVNAAQGEVARVKLDILWQEWQVAQEARLETARLGWLERRVKLAESQLGDEAQTSAQLQQGFDAGDITADQLGVQIAAKESVRGNLIALEQAQIESRNRLLALLGQPEDTALVVEDPAPESVGTLPASADLIAPCLARRIDLEALRRGYAAADDRVWQAVLEQFPNVSVGIASQRNESRLKFFGGFVSFGVPAFDRNQAAVQLTESTRERLGLEYTARTAQIRNTVDSGLELLSWVHRRLPEIVAGIAPLESLAGDEALAVESGDVNWLTYVTIRLALFDQRLQEAAMSQLATETRIGLETACGHYGWPIEPMADQP